MGKNKNELGRESRRAGRSGALVYIRFIHSRRALAATMFAIAAAAFQFGPTLLRLHETGLHWWFNAGWVLSALLASLGCFRAAYQSVGSDRRAFRDFGTGCSLWLAGTLFWQYYEVRQIAPPFPALADAAYLVASMFFLKGMFHYGSVKRLASRLQICNFAITLCAVALSAFVLMFQPIAASRVSALGTLVAFLYPVLWFGTAAFGSICLFLYAPREKRLLVGIIILAGVTSQAFADLFYGLALMRADYQVGSFYDGLWVVGFLLIFWASAEHVNQVKRGVHPQDSYALSDSQRLAEAFIPAVAVAVVLLSGSVSGKLRGSPLFLVSVPVVLVFAGSLGVREHWALQVERSLRSSANAHRDRLASVLESTTDSVVVFDRDWRITYMNERATKMVGVGGKLAVGAVLWEAFPEEVGGKFDQQFRSAVGNQTLVWFEEFLSPFGIWVEIHGYPTPNGFTIFFRDITERRRTREKVEHLAAHDPLTGLPNRRVFRERLNEAIGQASASSQVAVLCLDLDQFKDVNDTLGHPAGDALLMHIADRLRASARETDTVARMGGDEFAVLQTKVEHREDSSRLAQRIIDAVGVPFELNGDPVRVGVTIGIALAPMDGTEPDQVYKKADIALYAGKAENGGIYRFFEPAMEERICARQSLKAELNTALENSELELAFQPIIDLHTNRICSFEALLRWRHPVRGLVGPAEFIPIAEETGLIIPIGDWVLGHACAEASKWPKEIRLAVNLSPVQFRSRNLPDRVSEALSSTGLSPPRLELEITESVLLQDSVANLATLHALRDQGIRIALDDFGTGYSSLSYVQKFPFNKIKIDRSFIGNLTDREDSRAIVRAVTNLGHSLGLAITAEGVETRRQLDRVRAKGCDEAQGYFFSPPVPAHSIPKLLDKLRTDRIWWTDPSSRREADLSAINTL